LAAFAYDALRNKPVALAELDGCRIELWVRDRKNPRTADAIVAPVPTDLKLAHGVAKLIRLWTANRIQAEADLAAPRSAGDVLVGSGAKYKFDKTVLAVVTDSAKVASQEGIAAAIRNALEACVVAGAASVIVPDFTDDLLQQPKTISDEEWQKTAATVAKATVNALLTAPEGLTEIAIWVWKPESAGAFRAEFARLGQAPAEAAPAPA
jgi:O-acetyl-ADP-ribose deacetylase (regulator of RNase III)